MLFHGRMVDIPTMRMRSELKLLKVVGRSVNQSSTEFICGNLNDPHDSFTLQISLISDWSKSQIMWWEFCRGVLSRRKPITIEYKENTRLELVSFLQFKTPRPSTKYFYVEDSLHDITKLSWRP